MIQTFLKPLYIDIRDFVLDTLFPITCLVCDDSEGKFICADCRSLLTQLNFQRCIVCQKPTIGGLTHPKCQSPHTADGLISFYDYHDENVAKIIISGKYSFLPGVFEELGEMVAAKLIKSYPALLATSYTLTAIPLHKRRLRWRGFNQAEELCKSISEFLNSTTNDISSFVIKMTTADMLVRQNATKTQKDLKKLERIKNVEGAFKLQKGANIHGQNILLVDDVTTTGSTLLEAAKILKRNGAKTVICLTVARD